MKGIDPLASVIPEDEIELIKFVRETNDRWLRQNPAIVLYEAPSRLALAAYRLAGHLEDRLCQINAANEAALETKVFGASPWRLRGALVGMERRAVSVRDNALNCMEGADADEFKAWEELHNYAASVADVLGAILNDPQEK